ncbi:MAG: dienelactone hydrolase family protein [Alphaproteobacteria bacterium]|nr:dienelactone hydrolase family protein [Alphaproteobacteria bacterium]
MRIIVGSHNVTRPRGLITFAPVFLWLAVAVGPAPVQADDPYRNCFRDRSRAEPQTTSPGRTIVFAVPGGGRIAQRTGLLHMPESANGPVPAVIMVPGTGGVDERQDFHRAHLLKAGIATFVVDIKCGIFRRTRDRPEQDVHFPAVYAALRTLRRQPGIAADRIAVMGWSYGAGIAVKVGLVTNTGAWLKSGEQGFAAHVAFYGGCHQASDLAGERVPVLELVGEEDNYASTRKCHELENEPPYLTVRRYPGAHHGFDRVDRCRKRRERSMCWHERSATKARREVATFLTGVLKPASAAK